MPHKCERVGINEWLVEVEDALNLGRWRWIDATPAGGGVHVAMMTIFVDNTTGGTLPLTQNAQCYYTPKGRMGVVALADFQTMKHA